LRGTHRGLHGSEVVGGYIEGAVVVADEDVKHGVARATCHGFDDLIGDWGDARVAYGDSIERLEVVDESKGAGLLLHAKPARAVGGIRVFIHT